MEDGSLASFASRWKTLEPDCDRDINVSLSIEKLSSLFALVSFGFAIAVTVFAAEIALSLSNLRPKKPSSGKVMDAKSVKLRSALATVGKSMSGKEELLRYLNEFIDEQNKA